MFFFNLKAVFFPSHSKSCGNITRPLKFLWAGSTVPTVPMETRPDFPVFFSLASSSWWPQPLFCPLGLWVSTEAVPFTFSASRALSCSLSLPHVPPSWPKGDALGPVDRIYESSLLSDGGQIASQSSWPENRPLPSSHKHPLCA